MKISVIIPCYNTNIEYVNRAVMSIINQTYSNFEIIIVDDGSEKKNAELYDKEIVQDERIVILHQENKGVSVARNTGIDHAVGEYIMFVDADDELLPYCLEEAVKCISEHNVDMVIGGNYYTESFDRNEKFASYGSEIYESATDIELLKTKLISIDSTIKFGNNWYIGKGPVARVVKSEIVKKVKFKEDFVLGEDVIWNQELIRCCNKIAVIKRVWYIYYINENSATKRANQNISREYEKELKELKKIVDLNNDNIFRVYCEHLFDYIYKTHECCLNKKIKSIDKKYKRKIKKRLYGQEPWVYAKSSRYIKIAEKRQLLKAILYKTKLLFLYYDLKSRRKHYETKFHN